jgi:hypothetical protein
MRYPNVHLSNASHFTGEKNWQKLRGDWVRKQRTSDNADNSFDLDVEHIMVCLHSYKPFPAPVPLPAITEILNICWEEEEC